MNEGMLNDDHLLKRKINNKGLITFGIQYLAFWTYHTSDIVTILDIVYCVFSSPHGILFKWAKGQRILSVVIKS